MNVLLRKLSSYNILNNIIPGILFVFFWDKLFPQFQIGLNQNAYLENVFIYYFFGMIAGRFGSTIIESFYKKIKFIRYCKYSRYIKAEQIDNKISILLETNNLYRTSTAVFFFLFIAKVIFFIYNNDICAALKLIIGDHLLKAVFAFFILFSFSFRKQSDYICKRINNALNNKATAEDS